MAIPESQLQTWSKQGSITQSASTYSTIKRALEANSVPYASREYDSFLQGSYGNSTNIYADSDVDVVMRLKSIFYYDLDRLAESDRDLFRKAYPGAPYTLPQFKTEVSGVLQKNFGKAVKPGKKAIFIPADGNRRDADVLPTAMFRRYNRFGSFATASYVEGICFFLDDGTQIVNFPKQHSENCTKKHQDTNQWFKPTVRLFKNLRNRMIDDGLIEAGLAPSYFIEGLLYNVPNDKFGGNFEDTVVNLLNWLVPADKTKFLCANEQYYLLFEGSAVTWRAASCKRFLDAAVDLWKSWK